MRALRSRSRLPAFPAVTLRLIWSPACGSKEEFHCRPIPLKSPLLSGHTPTIGSTEAVPDPRCCARALGFHCERVAGCLRLILAKRQVADLDDLHPADDDPRLPTEVDIANLDPAFYVSQDDVIVADCILEGLVTFKPGTFDVVNNLADTFEISSDKLQYHFKLKPGIEWQKGYGEVRASDVKFSYERIAGLTKPKLNSPYSGDWQALETVRVEGPYEGTIILKEPFAPLLHSTMPVGSGKVLPEKAVNALGKKWATNIVGSGPWQFDSWVPGQRTTLSRFEKYSGANSAYAVKVPWTSIQTDVISSDVTAFSAVETGSPLLCWLGTSVVSRAQATPTLSLFSRPTQAFYFLSINVLDPVLKNTNLRKAIRSAIDVPGIVYDHVQRPLHACLWAHPRPRCRSATGQMLRTTTRTRPGQVVLRQQRSRQGVAQVDVRTTTPTRQPARIIAVEPQRHRHRRVGRARDSRPRAPIPGGLAVEGLTASSHYPSYVTEPDPYLVGLWFACSEIGLWNWGD